MILAPNRTYTSNVASFPRRSNKSPYACLKLHLVCAFFIFTHNDLASAQSDNPATLVNGCGSGWNVWLVPDSIPVLGCQLKEACNRHDLCYGKCESKESQECAYLRCKSGGDLYESDRCRTDITLLRSLAESRERKALCDQKLSADITSANAGKFACAAVGIVYRLAVKEWGDSAFSGFDDETTIEAWRQPKEEYDKAIRDFFLHGTQEQFEAFVRTQDGNSSKVNFDRPLRFDAERGLINTRIPHASQQ